MELLSELFFVYIASLLVGLVSFLLPTLIIPIYVLRFALKRFARIWGFIYKLGEILSPSSNILASNNLYVKPKEVSLIYFVMEGELSMIDVDILLLKIVGRKNNHKEPCYPELKQYMAPWFGFYFWKYYEQKFRIRDHFELYENEDKSDFQENQLPEFAEKCLAEPFPKYRSPWKMILIKNFKANKSSKRTRNEEIPTPKSLIVFRFHHALADVFSFTKLVNFLSDEPYRFPEPSRSYLRKSFSEKFLALILLPYRLVKAWFMGPEANELTTKTTSGEMVWTIPSKIHTTVLKDITRHFKIESPTILTLAGLAGGLRQAYSKNELKVPSVMSVSVPKPARGHPNHRIVNQVTMLTINLPLEIDDPVERILAIQDIYKNALKDTTTILKYDLKASIGSLFHWIAKPLAATSVTSGSSAVQVTVISGPLEQAKILGRCCTDMGYFAGLTMGNPGALLNTMTYGKKLRITCGIQKDLLATLSNPLDDFASGFRQEIQALYDARAVSPRRFKYYNNPIHVPLVWPR